MSIQTTPVKIRTTQDQVLHATLASAVRNDASLKPALLIAPGQDYHRDSPLLKQLAERAAAAGYMTLRFDWHFFQAGGRASETLQAEMEDAQAALTYLRQQAGVDPERIFIAGKSLGSVVAYRLFRQDPQLKGLTLYTPILPQPGDEIRHYPGLASETRALQIIAAAEDGLCPLLHLYAALCQGPPRAWVNVVPGDHSFRPVKDKTSNTPAEAASIDQAITNQLIWLEHHSGG